MDEFTTLLERVQQHFTPSEFLEFLGVGWDTLLDNEILLDKIEERIDDIKEEIGVE